MELRWTEEAADDLERITDYLFDAIRPVCSKANVDLDRLSRVPSRVVKGLFWKHTGHRLPNEYEVITYSASGIQPATVEQRDGIKKVIGGLIDTQQIWGVGDTFRYLVGFEPDNKHASVWLTLFFRRVLFLSFIIESKDASLPMEEGGRR